MLLCFGDTQLRMPRLRRLFFALLTVFLQNPVFIARYSSDGHACLPFSWFVKSAIWIRMAFSGGSSPSAFTALISSGNIVKSSHRPLQASPEDIFQRGVIVGLEAPLSLRSAFVLFFGKKLIKNFFRPKQRLRVDRNWLWYFAIISPTPHRIFMHVEQRSYVADGVKFVINSSHYLTH